MTIVEAWQLWLLWRLLVWAAVGATLLAFSIPSPDPQPQAALPQLPPPSYQPPQAPAPPLSRPDVPAQPAPATAAPEAEIPPASARPLPSLSPVETPELKAAAVAPKPGLVPQAGLDGVAPAADSGRLRPLQPSKDPALDGVAVEPADEPRGPKPRADLDGIEVDSAGGPPPALHPDIGTLNSPP